MELDQLLNLTSSVAGKLLPILGAVVLFFLIQFFRKLVTLMISANDAVKSLQDTLDSANKQLEMLDKPMQTLNDISETVDHVHEASKSAVRSVIATLIDNVGALVKSVTKKEEADASASPQDKYQKAQPGVQTNIQSQIQKEIDKTEAELTEMKQKEEAMRGESNESDQS